MKETLNESFSLETTAFITLFLHKDMRVGKCLLYMVTFVCILKGIHVHLYASYQIQVVCWLFRKRQKRWKCLALVVKLVIRAPVQGHVIYWEGWKLTIKSELRGWAPLRQTKRCKDTVKHCTKDNDSHPSVFELSKKKSQLLLFFMRNLDLFTFLYL